MSAEIPSDLAKPIRNLERQALQLIAMGTFEMAKNIYKTIYETLHTRQSIENRRIHLGAPLHMMGLTSLFQEDAKGAFRYFLLAYITDTINTRQGQEDDADGSPACGALQGFFGVADSTLQLVKEMARSEPSRNSPFDPELFLKQLLREREINVGDLLRTFSTREPSRDEIEKIRERLFQSFFVTKSGRTLLNKVTRRYGSRVLSKAAEIARKEGHPEEIRESDVREAISELRAKWERD